MLFVGILIHDRGLRETIAAMPEVLRTVPDALLVVVGDGPEKPVIEELVAHHGLEDSVLLAGWQNHADLPAYYQRARVGLLPFLPIGQIHFTLANKLFDYLGAGLPVVATDVAPMRRILQDAEVGLLADPRDPGELAQAIIASLQRTDDEQDAMKQRAVDLVQQEYSWSYDAGRLVAAVEAVAPSGSEG